VASMEITSILSELIPVYRKIVCGKFAIALAGAHAKGMEDDDSDLDIFVYADDYQPYRVRKAVFEALSGDDRIYVSEDIGEAPWGGSIDFTYGSLRVETNVKLIGRVDEVIDECLRGSIRIYPASWTLNGYYDFIHLSEIGFIVPLEDDFDVILNWKNRVQRYPLNLKRAIIREFWWKSRQWVDNFHYISAMNRLDYVYTSGIVQQTFQNVIQVLFALNETYFSGDKKIEKQLKTLRFCPECLTANLEILFTMRRQLEFMQLQRKILKDALNEIEAAMAESDASCL
jgi:predicted nucleotidyltransferase